MYTTGNLSEMVNEILAHMSEIGYSKSYINTQRKFYVRLQKYCNDNTITAYTVDIGERYLSVVRNQQPPLCNGTIYMCQSAVRRLNCLLVGEQWQPLRKPKKSLISSRFDNVLKDYESYLSKPSIAEKQIRQYLHLTAWFLRFIADNGCACLDELSPQYIYEAFDAASCKASFRRTIRVFLKYAYDYGLIQSNLSLIVPSVAKHQTVPTVYSPLEVEQMLSSVDRATELGKRNYAILLMAARLGLRASDIAGLEITSITENIEIVQRKTKVPLTLPLLEEIKVALDDYINNARPESNDKHVFLNQYGYGAVTAETVGYVANKAFGASGINCTDRKRGSHSLRSSLATALHAEGNDYHIIQKILGQTTVQSTKSYIRADVEQLRLNALPVPPPIGNFESLLAGRKVQ